MPTLIAIAAGLLLAVILLRVLGRIVPLPLVLGVLAAAVLVTAYGINTTTTEAEIGHLLTNLFGASQ